MNRKKEGDKFISMQRKEKIQYNKLRKKVKFKLKSI